MGEFGIGQPVPRTEDPRLLRGGGKYADDLHGHAKARHLLGKVLQALLVLVAHEGWHVAQAHGALAHCLAFRLV